MAQEPEPRPPPDGLLADRATFVGRMWDRATRHPFLALAILVAIQTIPALWSRDLTFFDEVRHGDFVTQAWVGDPLKVLLARIPGYERTSAVPRSSTKRP